MAKLYNLARMTTATTGTGPITLGAAVSGYLTFAQAGVKDGDIVSYAIRDGDSSEIGVGIYSSSDLVLKRNVTNSTNANEAISLSGMAETFITPRAEDLAFPIVNRVINPTGAIWQLQNSGAAAITDGAYAFDQWIGLVQSAALTASQVAMPEDATPSLMRFTQTSPTAQRFGAIQWIETSNVLDLRGQNIVLSARVRMSSSTTLRYAIIEWTGTADIITKDVVADWMSGTYTRGNFFNSMNLTIAATGSTALTANVFATISLSGMVGASMNNIAVFLWTDSIQPQNVTLDWSRVDLRGAQAVGWQTVRSFQEEIALCSRYYEKSWNLATAPGTNTSLGQHIGSLGIASLFRSGPRFAVRKRAAPTIVVYSNGVTNRIGNEFGDSVAPDQAPIVGEGAFAVNVTSGAGAPWSTRAVGTPAFFQWTADARL